MADQIENRIDRIERVVEQLATAMVMLAQNQAELTKDVKEAVRGIAELRESQKHTDENLGVLIKMMDEWIRGNPRNGRGGDPTSPANG
jgi:peptidoglycan hydrolase CwlO-like protein